jgi:hypothetical protein
MSATIFEETYYIYSDFCDTVRQELTNRKQRVTGVSVGLRLYSQNGGDMFLRNAP